MGAEEEEEKGEEEVAGGSSPPVLVPGAYPHRVAVTAVAQGMPRFPCSLFLLCMCSDGDGGAVVWS